MASNNSLVIDIIGDFIHSKIWAAPIHTFIEANCATFDYDDDDEVTDEDETALPPLSSMEEQKHIHQQYQYLVDALIDSLGYDLNLDQNDLKQACQLPKAADDSAIIDEPYEQLYAARNFELFQEMMRRKNLILQLQALVSLQLQWGLLKESDAGDDLVLSLLLQATAPSHRELAESSPEPIEERVEKHQLPEKENEHPQHDDDDDVVETVDQPPPTSHRKKESQPRKPPKREYHLPDLRVKGGPEPDADWYRKLQRSRPQEADNEDSTATHQSQKTSTPQTIGAVPEEVLREKLRELSVRSTPAIDDDARKTRHDFLEEQRKKIAEKKRAERTLELEKETQQQPARNARPQSAALAHKAMATMNKTNESNQKEEQQKQNPNDEIIKQRRALNEKIKREVIDKR